MAKPFWQTKSLDQMSTDEWESLCDGCGKCCLLKLEDEDSGDIYFTDICCVQFDSDSCRCSDYENRATLVSDCLQLSADNIDQINSLPKTCAYRLLQQGEELPEWHPLIAGNSHRIHQSGNSVMGRVLSEQHVHPNEVEERIIHWVE